MFLLDDLILAKMKDEESVQLYKARLRYTFSRDYDALLDSLAPIMANYQMVCYEMRGMSKRLNSRTVIIYGLDKFAQRNKRALDQSDLTVIAYAGPNPTERERFMDGIPIISAEELLKSEYRQCMILIGSYDPDRSKQNTLISLGIEEERIYAPMYPSGIVSVNRPMQYFDVFQPLKDEVFLDVGAYDGNTVMDFNKWNHGQYKKIFCVEPLQQMHPILRLKCGKYHNVEILPYAAWKCRESLFFDEQEAGSKITGDGKCIQGIALDDVLDGPVTFIKMDIEGAELEALRGLKKIIRKYRPRIAVCIYHRRRDVLTIPLYLLYLVPKYRFTVRHYSGSEIETVLFAAVED